MLCKNRAGLHKGYFRKKKQLQQLHVTESNRIGPIIIIEYKKDTNFTTVGN